MASREKNATEIRAAFFRVGQEHLFSFWEQLDPQERASLASDLAQIDVAQIPDLSTIARTSQADHMSGGQLQPPKVIKQTQVSQEVRARGVKAISGGKVAALTVAGGQGTRLGLDGPKGALGISPVKNKTLFQLFAESILAAQHRYEASIPWYIMTSPVNHEATREFFQRHEYFRLVEKDVVFFQQGVMPAFDASGRILLEQKNRVALSPDGHGGSLLAMSRNGILPDMAQRGVEYISYFQVDNPLVACIDPAFIGLHIVHGSEMSSKTLPKADDFEKVGNFVMSDGKLTVVEYSDLPEVLAKSRNPDGTRKFDAANVAIHVISRAFVERLTADSSRFGLPWHRAVKKAPHIDLNTGRRVEPEKPNAVKLEAFIFDALPLAQNPILLQTDRVEEFSPVKNKTGIDSMETAQLDMSRRAARWLAFAGFQVPQDETKAPIGRYEISPTLALDAMELKERIQSPPESARLPRTMNETFYLG